MNPRLVRIDDRQGPSVEQRENGARFEACNRRFLIWLEDNRENAGEEDLLWRARVDELHERDWSDRYVVENERFGYSDDVTKQFADAVWAICDKVGPESI